MSTEIRTKTALRDYNKQGTEFQMKEDCTSAPGLQMQKKNYSSRKAEILFLIIPYYSFMFYSFKGQKKEREKNETVQIVTGSIDFK